MTELDRRSLFALGAGTVIAATAAAQAAPAATTAAAPAPPLPGAPGWQRFKLGDCEITAVLDGMRPGEGPYPTFGANQTAEAVAALMQQNLLPPNRFVNTFTPVIVRAGREVMLIDTGFGKDMRANGMGFLGLRMVDAGIRPEDVTMVVLTHMHGDHIGGLMEDGKPAFPNASYVFGRKEFDFWTAPERAGEGERIAGNAKAVTKNVVPLRDRASMVTGGDSIAPVLTVIDAPGHTPGHLVFRLDSSGKSLIFTGDTANHFVASLQKPDWHVAFDQDKAMAAQTRRKVFDMIAAERLPFMGFHMPFPAVGFVEKFGEGYRYIPETYQFEA